MSDEESEKECKTCLTVKPYSDYYSRKTTTKSRGEYIYCPPECKECTKERSTKWNRDNPESVKEYDRRNHLQPHRPEQKRINSARYRENGGRRKWEEKNRDKLIQYRLNRGNKYHDITDSEWEACKKYFDYSCAYCGLSLDDHLLIHKQALHKEHVEHDGEDDLSNCVPSCKPCNSSKHIFSLEMWYTPNNNVFSEDRLRKINKWLERDFMKYVKSQ